MTVDPTQLTTETCWSCPTCAFTFAAYHANADGSLTCPVCEVEEKDRHISELERDLDNSRTTAADEIERQRRIIVQNDSDWSGLRAEHEAQRRQIAELESRLATARDMLRHYEQERDSWGAAYKQRAAMTDARIKELEAGMGARDAAAAQGFLDLGAANRRIHALEAGLRDALGCWQYPPLTHQEKTRKDEIWAMLQSEDE